MFRYINFTPTAPARRARSFDELAPDENASHPVCAGKGAGLIKPLASNHDVLKPGEPP